MSNRNKPKLFLAKVKGKAEWITHIEGATGYTDKKKLATSFDQEYVKEVVKLCSTKEKPLMALPA